jgi:hypothetical protein
MCSTPCKIKEFQVEDIREIETCEYDGKWWLACVLQVNDSKIKLTFFASLWPQ